MFILSKASIDLAQEYWKAKSNAFDMARDTLVHKIRLDASKAPWPFSSHLHSAADELARERPATFVAMVCGPWEYTISYQDPMH